MKTASDQNISSDILASHIFYEVLKSQFYNFVAWQNENIHGRKKEKEKQNWDHKDFMSTRSKSLSIKQRIILMTVSENALNASNRHQ